MCRLVESAVQSRAYDLPSAIAIVDHHEHGRLLIEQGYGGECDLRGGAYRWVHGNVHQIGHNDTLESLSREDSDMIGFSRLKKLQISPGLSWEGRKIESLAREVGLA